MRMPISHQRIGRNVIDADASIVGLSALSNVVANASGMVLGGLLTASLSTAFVAANAPAAQDLTASMALGRAELAYTAVAVTDATHLLSQGDGAVRRIRSPSAGTLRSPTMRSKVR